jgi:hypothetical protein
MGDVRSAFAQDPNTSPIATSRTTVYVMQADTLGGLQAMLPRRQPRGRQLLPRVLRLTPSAHLGNFQPAQVGIIRPALTIRTCMRKPISRDGTV